MFASSGEGSNLLLILLTLVVDDVVEAELVDTLGGRDDAQPVTELLLLEELLGPVSCQYTDADPFTRISGE